MKLPIVNRFLVLSFLCILALAVGMGFALSSLLTRAALEWEWENTAAFTRRQMELSDLDALFTAPRGQETQERWRTEVSHMLRLPGVVRIKVWDREATVLWSDEAKLMGQRFPENEELRASLAGKVAVEISRLTKHEHAYERGRSGLLAEVYVPILSKETGKVLGVVEVYKIHDRLAATIRWGRIIIWTISLAGGGALYLVLLPLVRQVYGREVRETTLRVYAGRLEHEVAERTRELQKQTERLAQLNAMAQTVTASRDSQRVFEAVVQGALQLLHVTLARLWVIEPSTGHIVLVASASSPDRPINLEGAPTRLARGQGRVSWVIEHRRAIYTPVLLNDPTITQRAWIERERLVSRLSVPLLRGDRALGTLVVMTRERREFSREEQGLLETFAAQAAGAIENAQLLEAERETRRELAVSEARYRELFENIIDIVYVHDLEGRILAVNEAAVRASGYPRDELLRMNIAELMAPDDLAPNAELIRRMVAGERVSELFVAEFTQKDGSRAMLECNGRLVFKDGVPVAIQGVARDITLRRKLEVRQAAFVEIVKELSSEDDFDRLFSQIGKRVCALLGTDSAGLIHVERDEQVLRGSYVLEAPERAWRPRKLSESHIEPVVRTRQPRISSNMADDPHWRDSSVVTRFGYRAILEVPVILRDNVIGVLGVLNKSPRSFSEDDVALLVSVADHTAIALDRTNLLRELKTRLRETETLLTVSQAISLTLDPTETMRRVARETARALGADMVSAYLADPDETSLRPVAGYHVPKQLFDIFRKFPIPLKGHPFLEEAWKDQHPVWSDDAQADPRIDREMFERIPHGSVLFVPMIVKEVPIGGVFVIWWEDKHHFIPEEIRLVEGIGRQAALAMENARLYEQHKGVVEQLRLFHQAIRAIGEAVVILDLEGRIIFVNEAFKRMYRWSEAEALGATPAAEASRFNQPEITKQIHTETLRGGWQGELRSRRKTGEEFPIFLTTAPVLDETGQPVAMVGVSRDLSQLKLLQAQLLQAEKLAATGQLAAGVAHEINNPLSVILGFASLAIQKSPPPAFAEDLNTIRTEALRAAKIIRDLLTFARPTPHERHPVDLNEILRETLALQSYHLATDQIEVLWQLTEPLPPTLADRGQLQQVIMNLVLNAHQAMKSAHGRGALSIATGYDGGFVWAALTDTGPGIATDLLPRIFDPFLTTKPVGQGSGLGLSVSYGIVQAHGGELLADSPPGHGATFTLRLPVVDCATESVAPPHRPPSKASRALAVLVVDDEPAVARLLALMVEQLGHHAEVVHSGREALARLEQSTYDLITLDLRMPQMSGQEVWRRLQNFPRRPRVLFVTGDFASDEARTFLAISGQPYLEKPFQLGDLSRKLNELGL